MIALGLINGQTIPSQTSASPRTVNGARFIRSPSSDVPRRGPKSSSPFSGSSALDGGRRGWRHESPTHPNIATRKHGGLPPSPSISKFKTRMSPGTAPTAADSQFAGGSFVDDAVEEKPTRGLSNLFKPRSASKTAGKGGKTGRDIVTAKLT
jgi:hypothetical protein